MDIRPFQRADAPAVVSLWHKCGLTRPWNDPYKDIARKLTTQPELFLVGTVEDRLVATAMAGFDGHRGWLNYLAVAPGVRGRGYGRDLMQRVEELLRERGCAKVSLLVRAANDQVAGFYRRLGYGQDEVIVLGKRLIRDDA